MARVLRGEIYWADLDPVRGHEQGGHRPVVVLSHDIFNERSQTAIVMALTTQRQRAGYPLTWRLPPAVFFDPDAWVKISQIRTVSTERLAGQPIARLSPRETGNLVEGLLELVG